MTSKRKLQEQIDHLYSLDEINRNNYSEISGRTDIINSRIAAVEEKMKAVSDMKGRIDIFQESGEEIDGTVKFLRAVHEQEREAERAASLEEFRKNTRIWPSGAELGPMLIGMSVGVIVTAVYFFVIGGLK